MAGLLAVKAAHPAAKLVVGNSEVGIEMKFKNADYPILVGTTHVPELNQIKARHCCIASPHASAMVTHCYCPAHCVYWLPHEESLLRLKTWTAAVSGMGQSVVNCVLQSLSSACYLP